MEKKILILNMTRMGDLIQSTPVICGLRKKYPTAHIGLLVTSFFQNFQKEFQKWMKESFLMLSNLRIRKN